MKWDNAGKALSTVWDVVSLAGVGGYLYSAFCDDHDMTSGCGSK